MAPARSSRKDLSKRISPESPQNLLCLHWIMQGPLRKEYSKISTKFWKNAARPTQTLDLRTRNAYGHVKSNFTGESPRPTTDRRFAQACAVERHMGMSQGQCSARITIKCRGKVRFVRACAVEMHMDISQERFYARTYKEKIGKSRGLRGGQPTWTWQRDIFMRDFTGKMPETRWSTLI